MKQKQVEHLTSNHKDSTTHVFDKHHVRNDISQNV